MPVGLRGAVLTATRWDAGHSQVFLADGSSAVDVKTAGPAADTTSRRRADVDDVDGWIDADVTADGHRPWVVQFKTDGMAVASILPDGTRTVAPTVPHLLAGYLGRTTTLLTDRSDQTVPLAVGRFGVMTRRWDPDQQVVVDGRLRETELLLEQVDRWASRPPTLLLPADGSPGGLEIHELGNGRLTLALAGRPWLGRHVCVELGDIDANPDADEAGYWPDMWIVGTWRHLVAAATNPEPADWLVRWPLPRQTLSCHLQSGAAFIDTADGPVCATWTGIPTHLPIVHFRYDPDRWADLLAGGMPPTRPSTD